MKKYNKNYKTMHKAEIEEYRKKYNQQNRLKCPDCGVWMTPKSTILFRCRKCESYYLIQKVEGG
jgi:tRNA(Ile2) C34 agmatinyltransferase TiaS